jgi:hypothetical protein
MGGEMGGYVMLIRLANLLRAMRMAILIVKQDPQS